MIDIGKALTAGAIKSKFELSLSPLLLLFITYLTDPKMSSVIRQQDKIAINYL